MRMLLTCHDLADNALGRAYSLWLCAEHLGWDTLVTGPSTTRGLWTPLTQGPFSERCRIQPRWGLSGATRAAAEAFRPDVIVAVKLWPASLEVARGVGRELGVPVVADIDDPDIESVRSSLAGGLQSQLAARWALRSRVRRMGRLEELRAGALQHPRTVSNPELQRLYGGEVVPHVRRPGPDPSRPAPGVRLLFAGTPRPHKGIDLLREAAATAGADLVVTAPAPRDARANEQWVGNVAITELPSLLRSSTAVAVLSRPGPEGAGQFPVKVVDAMLAGRPVIASDVPVLRWALGGAGIVVAPELGAVTGAIEGLRDGDRTARIGRAAREEALRRFVPGVAARTLARVCASASAVATG